MFDTRNTKTFAYDEGLLSEYDEHLKKANTAHNLILFHLMGQHVNYRQRYPKGRGTVSCRRLQGSTTRAQPLPAARLVGV